VYAQIAVGDYSSRLESLFFRPVLVGFSPLSARQASLLREKPCTRL
jgi:hypothetical protein